MEVETHDRQTSLAVHIGLIANVILAGLKTTIGILGHSPALLADGINSTADVAYYIVVSVFMKRALQPPDDEHPHGHRQFESIAAVAVGAFVITTAITILWTAISRMFNLFSGNSEAIAASGLALLIAAATVAAKIVLTRITQRLGTASGSVTVSALAKDHRNDIFSALAATIGIIMARMGYLWVDPLAGALVALVVLRTGIQIVQDSSLELMTSKPDPELIQQIETTINHTTGVEKIEEISVHRYGPYLVLNLVLGMDGELTIRAGHEICNNVEQQLYQKISFLSRVHIHYHPST